MRTYKWTAMLGAAAMALTIAGCERYEGGDHAKVDAAAIEIRPTYAKALYERGLARARLGQAAASKADLARAIALDPDVAKK